MKHSDIYKKFMIEYDKAQIASSYPSLTEYEIATVLDKAYLALIAQKLTGNNPRQVPFEGDIKAIEDIRPLIKNETLTDPNINYYISNQLSYKIPNNIDFLYYVSGWIQTKGEVNSIDNKKHLFSPVILINHEDSNKFKNTTSNLPWISTPVCYLDEGGIHVLVDSYKTDMSSQYEFILTYVKKPTLFITDNISTSNIEFELNDSMAEELINLAIILSAEIVESQRSQTKVQLRPLES